MDDEIDDSVHALYVETVCAIKPVKPICKPSRSRQLKLASLQTKDTEAVEVPLPISMHTGQIIMLTKMLTATDLRFYDFDAGAPVDRWRSGPSGSS